MSYADRIRKQIQDQKASFELLFYERSEAEMGRRPSSKRWSAFECVEHVNIALRHYIKHIDKGISKSIAKGQAPKEDYRPGFLGERFARFLAPREGIVRNRVKTLPAFRPVVSSNAKGQESLDDFRRMMDHLGDLAARSAMVDLDKTRVASPAGALLRFKLGDAFYIVLAHNERHLLQARKAMEAVSKQAAG